MLVGEGLFFETEGAFDVEVAELFLREDGENLVEEFGVFEEFFVVVLLVGLGQFGIDGEGFGDEFLAGFGWFLGIDEEGKLGRVLVDDGKFRRVGLFGIIDEIEFLVPLADGAGVEPSFEFQEEGFFGRRVDFFVEECLEAVEFGGGASVSDGGEGEVGDAAAEDEAKNSPGKAGPAGVERAGAARFSGEEIEE